jgi:hypothetical protein
MRVVAANAPAGNEGVDRAGPTVAGADAVVDVIADPGRHRRDQHTALKAAELTLHKGDEEVGLAKPARPQIWNDMRRQFVPRCDGECREGVRPAFYEKGASVICGKFTVRPQPCPAADPIVP